MNNFSSISWTFFFYGAIVLILLWYLLCKTNIGRNFISIETKLNELQWTRLFVVLVGILFILVNPLTHLIIIFILAFSFLFITQKKILGRSIFGEPLKKNIALINNSIDIDLNCHSKTEYSDINKEILRLKSVLFGFPYLKNKSELQINHLNGVFNIKGKVNSEEALIPFKQLLQNSKFEILKEK